MLPFAESIAALSVLQGALVVAPARPVTLPPPLRGRAWALVPPASIAGVVFAIRGMSHVADVLTWLALIAVPPLAAVALGWLVPRARPPAASGAAALFLIAWLARGSLAGEAAAALLSALSCVTLATLLAAVAPARWLKAGIVAMALIDAALVVGDLLQAPNNVLDHAVAVPGLPRLQHLVFGSALMGYGDVFVAATLGALLAAEPARRRRVALLTVAIALAFDLLFFAVRELPATVPVALALIADELAERHRVRRGRRRPVGTVTIARPRAG